MEQEGSSIGELMKAWSCYRLARLELLSRLHRPESLRDPVGEWSEMLVKQLLNGQFPLKSDGPSINPVQEGYDIVLEGENHIQVKSLSNPSGKWVNEHHIKIADKVVAYGIVFFHDLRPEVVLIFPKHHLEHICKQLGKRHGRQDTELPLTQTDFKQILAGKNDFTALGMRIWGYDNSKQQWEEWKTVPNTDTKQ